MSQIPDHLFALQVARGLRSITLFVIAIPVFDFDDSGGAKPDEIWETVEVMLDYRLPKASSGESGVLFRLTSPGPESAVRRRRDRLRQQIQEKLDDVDPWMIVNGEHREDKPGYGYEAYKQVVDGSRTSF